MRVLMIAQTAALRGRAAFSLHRVQVTGPSAAHVAEPGGFPAVGERNLARSVAGHRFLSVRARFWRSSGCYLHHVQVVHASCVRRKNGARAGDADTVSGTSLPRPPQPDVDIAPCAPTT